jgi:hypothetical protein
MQHMCCLSFGTFKLRSGFKYTTAFLVALHAQVNVALIIIVVVIFSFFGCIAAEAFDDRQL